jgi:hypothetical protein
MKRVLAVVLCTGLLAGCGDDDSDSSDAQIAAVVMQLEDASRAGDGGRICDQLFTENLAISVKRASKQECADEVAENVASDDAEFKLERLDVKGDNATAELVDQRGERSAVLFERDGDSWRIARISGVGS